MRMQQPRARSRRAFLVASSATTARSGRFGAVLKRDGAAFENLLVIFKRRTHDALSDEREISSANRLE
jgi:hypothetical protein